MVEAAVAAAGAVLEVPAGGWVEAAVGGEAVGRHKTRTRGRCTAGTDGLP